MGTGLLSFPVTTFNRKEGLDGTAYRDNIAWACSHPPAGLFSAGGTGEFFSLTPEEVDTVVVVAAALSD